MSVAKGDKLHLPVTVTGEPTPEITWSFNDQQINPDDRKIVQTDGGSSSLTVKIVQRDDTGNYKVTATNELGSDFTTFKIDVTGKFMLRKKK